jgi:transcriptional regulator with XRE-family HTH domain
MTKEWIREHLQRLGRSQLELSRHLGLDASAVSRLVKGERHLKGHEARGIAEFFGCSVDEVLHAFGSGTDGFTPRLVELPQSAELRQTAPLPVYGSAVGGVDGAFEFNGRVNEYVERPPLLAGVKNAYGVYITGESMFPVFRAGWLAHVNPNRPLTPGCGVVVQVRATDPEAPPLCYIKEYVRRTATKLVVSQYNPATELEWPLDRVVAAHRIVGIADM